MAVVSLIVFAGLPASGSSADWPTYLHDNQHTSFNDAATSITTANVNDLAPAWTFDGPTATSPPGRLYASPTVYGGKIYVGSNSGEFYRLDEDTGTVDWHENLGTSPALTCRDKGILSTASLATDPATGVLTVYVGAGDGNVDALRASDGQIMWQTPVNVDSATANDKFNFSSTLVDRGRVYQGISSSCDDPLTRGGLVEMDQSTGQVTATYYTVPEGSVGGSIWSSPTISEDGTAVYVSTGNGDPSDVDHQGDSISIVRLDADTLVKEGIWTCADPEPGCRVPNDTDFGGTPTLFTANLGGIQTAMVGALDKNGRYYALKQNPVNGELELVWSRFTGRSVSAAVWDGTHLFVVGNYHQGVVINGTSYPGAVRELDPSDGHVIWETGIASGAGLGFGSPTLDGGGILAAVTYNTDTGGTNSVYLLNANSGALLRTIPLTSPTFAQPVFAGRYLFVTDGNAADLTAYAPPSDGGGDFSVAQMAPADPVTVDSELAYTVTVSNTGGGGAVTVTDTPPPHATLESVTASQGSCSGASPITCDLGAVSSSATVDVVVTPILPGDVTNTASVPADATPGDDNSTWTVTAKAQPKTKYVSVDDAGYSPPRTSTRPGRTVQWAFLTQGHSATDAAGFFDSGVEPSGAYFRRPFTAAGKYTITDAGSSATSKVNVTVAVTPSSGSTSTDFTVTWASASATANQVYDVQMKTGKTWSNWKTGVTAPSAVFNSSSPEWAGADIYRFRARLRNHDTGQATGWSPASTSITVS